MQEWTEIRRKVLVEDVSKRTIIKEYGIPTPVGDRPQSQRPYQTYA